MKNGPSDIQLATPKASIVRVYRNPTPEDYEKVFASFYVAYPDSPPGEARARCAFDEDDNRYIWQVGAATHEMIAERLKKLYNISAKKTREAKLDSLLSAHIFGLENK
jgi:hypothetical protein